jgi:hypothetical protein
MHPGDHSGHVIDLGIEPTISQLQTQVPSISIKDESIERQIISTNSNKIQAINEHIHQSYQQVFLQKIN